jgi:ribonuclease R
MPTSSKSLREEILDLLADQSRALHAREIADRLALPERAYLDLLATLSDLALDRAVRALPGQRFRSARQAAVESREGRLHVNPRGFGFVSTPGLPDVFIPAQSLAGAMHGDRVKIRVIAKTRRGPEGSVEQVLDHANKRVGGVLRKRGRSVWLEADDPRILGPIVIGRESEGSDGDAAVVEVTRFPERSDENAEGKLLEALGPPGDPDVETRKVLLREDVQESFPDACEAQAREAVSAAAEAARQGREDLRSIALVTIDPDDARDHDDAIWVSRTDGGFEVIVAIADVAEYVREETPLDGEARKRGFSIYLPDRAVPMLPRALSSNACSLLAGEDRLCLSVRLQLDSAGKVKESTVSEAVMRSRARLTYTGVARAMRWTEGALPEDALPEDLHEVIEASDRLARTLRKRRIRRGSLELNVPEARIILDDHAAPVDVQRRAQDPGVKRAYQLIEELMLIANEAVALWMQQRGLRPVYRVHPPPDEAKLARLTKLCEALGIEFEIEEAIDPKRMSAFLARVAEHPLAEIIGMLTLRSLKQASYELENVGHFGLALACYLHFTSPIRRYPDLLVHRAVKQSLRGGAPQQDEALREAVQNCSERERRIMEIEREVSDLYRAVMMRARIGMIGSGRVMEILPSSVIVTLDDPFVDVRVSDQMLGNDTYAATDDGLALVGQGSGDVVKLGDRMKIRVEDVNLGRRQVLGRRMARESRNVHESRKTLRDKDVARGRRKTRGK